MEEKDEDVGKEGNNIISTDSKSNLSIEKENNNNGDKEEILSDEPKIFDCELIVGGNRNKVNFIVNEKKKNIEINLFLANTNKKDNEDNKDNKEKEDTIHLKTINQIDLVSFMSQEDMNEVKLEEINNLILPNANDKDKKKESSSLLDEKEICSLTYFPFVSKSECNFCKCIFCCDCKCKKNYKIKEFMTDYFLIKKDYIIQIKKSIYHISLPKLNELQAKNRKRKILSFVNPIGGKGNALTIWEKAQKIFSQANLEVDTIITRKFKEAYNYVLTLDPEKYDGFVACSGDGIIHEIINAIFHRNEEDKNKFLNHCAICPIPAGSGNALSKAISSYCGDDNRIENHCYYLCKGITKKIDVQEMQIKDEEKKVYSVIAFMYGFIADCDLDSEFLRCLGMFRTTLWGIIRYICLRDYLGTLYYLPQNASKDIINKMPDINENIEDITKYGLVKESDQWNIFITNNIKYASEDLTPHPLSELDDGYSDLFMIPQSKGGGRWPLLRYLLNDMDHGEIFTDEESKKLKNGYSYIKSKWWRFIPKKELNDPDDVNKKYNWAQMYSIDGERYPICPIQCCTINKIFSVYSGKE